MPASDPDLDIGGVSIPAGFSTIVPGPSTMATAPPKAVRQHHEPPAQRNGGGTPAKAAKKSKHSAPSLAATSPAAPKSRGRPREDPSVKCRAELAAFAQVPLDATSPGFRKFLGDEFKTKERQLRSLQTTLQAEIDSCTDIDVYDVLVVDLKRLQALLKVTASYAKASGAQDNSKFAAEFDEARVASSDLPCPVTVLLPTVS